jgi:hypothetical protein
VRQCFALPLLFLVFFGVLRCCSLQREKQKHKTQKTKAAEQSTAALQIGNSPDYAQKRVFAVASLCHTKD